MTAILRNSLLSKFSCLGDKCSDTCCQAWSMMIDEQMLERYKKDAPELLDAVEPAKETPWVMKKDKATGFCVKFEDGMCGIHKKYGDTFLGDACHFYPRVTRSLGDKTLMTATMSCPEVVRLALKEDALTFEAGEADRLPYTLKDYLPPEFSADDALSIHQHFLAATEDASSSPEKIFLHIAGASRSLDLIPRKSWPQAVPFYLGNANAYVPDAETNPADPFNLLHAVAGIAVATHRTSSERLKQTIREMEQALACTLDWESMSILTTGDSLPAYKRMRALWQQEGEVRFAPVLRRWLQMQLSVALYPFTGLGNNLNERATIIGVRLATVKLALMSACSLQGANLPEETVIRIIQSLSRLLDHLADPAFLLTIFNETGWNREPRLRGLLQ